MDKYKRLERGAWRFQMASEVAVVLLDSIHKNFDVGGRYDIQNGVAVGGNRKWRPSLRAKMGGQTLLDKGRLRDSVRVRIINGGRDVNISANTPYAAIHQFGGVIHARNAPYLRFRLPTGQWVSVKSVTIPARPYLVVQKGDMQTIQRLVSRSIQAHLG
jgi:phage gpG-like protein